MDRKNIGEMIKNGNKQMQFFTLFPHVFFFSTIPAIFTCRFARLCFLFDSVVKSILCNA